MADDQLDGSWWVIRGDEDGPQMVTILEVCEGGTAPSVSASLGDESGTDRHADTISFGLVVVV